MWGRLARRWPAPSRLSIKDLFIRFRKSNAFLYTLIMIVGAWLSVHCAAGFDDHLDWLNLFLSIEASVATCLLLDLQFRMSAEDRRMWARIEKELLDRLDNGKPAV